VSSAIHLLKAAIMKSGFVFNVSGRISVSFRVVVINTAKAIRISVALTVNIYT